MQHRAEPQSSKRLTDFSRDLRRKETPPERMLWSLLRDRRLGGIKFRRQQPIGPYVADFFCEAASLVLELDGHSHDDTHDKDRRRDEFMQSRGLTVLRICNSDLLKDPSAVADMILNTIGQRGGARP